MGDGTNWRKRGSTSLGIKKMLKNIFELNFDDDRDAVSEDICKEGDEKNGSEKL